MLTRVNQLNVLDREHSDTARSGRPLPTSAMIGTTL